MVKMAYRDEAKTDLVFAHDLHALNLDREYFCPGKDCPGRLRLQQGHGADANAATFSARHGSVPHRKYCIYSSNVRTEYGIPQPFSIEHIDRDSFDFNAAIQALIETPIGNYTDHNRKSVASIASSHGANLRLRHISQIYLMLKDMHPDDTIANMHVGEMLYDSRSFPVYRRNTPDGVYICESYRDSVERCYDTPSREIRTRITGDGHYVRLRFTDNNNFRRMRTFVYNHRYHNVIVAGNWHLEKGDPLSDNREKQDEHKFYHDALVCTIHNDRQYFLCH